MIIIDNDGYVTFYHDNFLGPVLFLNEENCQKYVY